MGDFFSEVIASVDLRKGTCMRKWEEASVECREEIVLEALHHEAVDMSEDVRILAPEIVPKDLTEGDGSRLFRLLDKNLVPWKPSSSLSSLNPQFDRLYSFTRSASDEQLPPPRGVRGFMEEVHLLRHSLFFNFFADILQLLVRSQVPPLSDRFPPS